MPTNKRKRSQTLRKLDGQQISDLVIGYSLIDSGKPLFASEEERREAWRQNREWLINEKNFGDLFFGGGKMKGETKPAAYYQYEKGLIPDKDFKIDYEITPDKRSHFLIFTRLRRKKT